MEIHHVPGPPGESGCAHGRLVADLLEPGFRTRYLELLAPINRYELGDLRAQAERWVEGLPANFQEEIDGMARGAGVAPIEAGEFLYADIARPTRDADRRAFSAIRDVEPLPGEHELPTPGSAGPMCSAVVTRANGGASEAITGGQRTWVARNCDWLRATLTRGTSCVVHATPGRIPVMAVGIRGDIDVDTGMNAERVWLHLHTLLSKDDPPRDRTCISWLFWAREALEVCASLDELERFIESTGRDRGVIAVAVDGKTGEGAVFECGKASHTRVDFDPGGPSGALFATNHTLAKPIDEAREAKARAGSTVGRFCTMRRLLADDPPEHGPDDLIDVLAEDGVEMRTPEHLRTIYSAVCDPSSEAVWFAAGEPEGTPAASSRAWRRVRWAW